MYDYLVWIPEQGLVALACIGHAAILQVLALILDLCARAIKFTYRFLVDRHVDNNVAWDSVSRGVTNLDWFEKTHFPVTEIDPAPPLFMAAGRMERDHAGVN